MRTHTFPTALIALVAVALALPAAADDRGRGDRFFDGPPHGKMIRLDVDQNGEITRDEFSSPSGKRFAAIDVNGDGLVTPEELDADFEAKQAEMQRRASERHGKMRERFLAQDANGDGAVSADEINDSLFARMDADGNGAITRDEIRPRRKHHRQF